MVGTASEATGTGLELVRSGSRVVGRTLEAVPIGLGVVQSSPEVFGSTSKVVGSACEALRRDRVPWQAPGSLTMPPVPATFYTSVAGGG